MTLRRSGFGQERTASQRSCAYCERAFWPSRPLQTVCGRVCAGEKAKADRVAKLESRKEAIQTIPELIKLAQKDFNAFIRERDRIAGHRCISSGRPLDWSGNGVDAGHYRSVGAASHLRFEERNCHAQSKRENQYRAGNAVDYRIGLIERINNDTEYCQVRGRLSKLKPKKFSVRKLGRDGWRVWRVQ